MKTPAEFANHCCSDFPVGLGVQEAIERIVAEAARQPRQVLRLPLRQALGQVLAEDLLTPFDIPGFDNSAMDGFALRHTDLHPEQPTHLRIVDAVFAGDQPPRPLEAGQCSRIMTGARVPPGADTVVMKEQVTVEGEEAIFQPGHQQGSNIRRAGEDLRQGQVAVAAGTLLSSPQLGVIASLGFPEVPVVRRPRVALFTSGDELRSHGETRKPGTLFDSNRFSLEAMGRAAGVEVLDLGPIPDTPAQLAQAMQDAAAMADVVVSSGGVSMGDADYIPSLLDELGEVLFWKMRMKPGHPLLFGRLGQALYFGLPGNPVSVMACFAHFVQPALQVLAGGRYQPPLQLTAVLSENLRSRTGRTEYQRGIFRAIAPGQFEVSSTGTQSSGALSSMARANCFIVLDEDTGRVEAGSTVLIEPFANLVG